MTIASEITRLQGAKADIKTSIEGKGVSVPSSAKLDTYSTYIDQINTGGWASGLSLYPTEISNSAYSNMSATAPISWEEGGIHYGLCATGFMDGNSTRHNPLCVFKKTNSTTDVQYVVVDGASLRNGSGTYGFSAYKSGTTVKAYTFTNIYTSSDRYTLCTQYTWNMTANTLTSTSLGTGTYQDYDPTDYGADLTGYTELSGSTWVNNTNTSYNIHDSTFYIYLTLK